MTLAVRRPIYLRLFPQIPQPRGYRFSLAGQEVLSDSPLETVLPQGRVEEIPAPVWKPLTGTLELGDSLEPYASLRGFIAGEEREIHCRGDEQHWIAAIPSIGTFSLNAAGVLRHTPSASTFPDPSNRCSLEEMHQAALGPLLILVLALRGIFCLHCSAALKEGRLSLFLGESGAGKSTLGRALGHDGWERIADDLLPVELVRGSLVAWTNFPQLKQPLEPSRSRISVGRIYTLGNASAIAIKPLSHVDSALALAANTAAARLFPSSLLASHFLAMTDWAGRTSERRLLYPRRLEMLPAVTRALRETDL